MRPYEVMVILDAGLEDQAIQAQVTRSTDLLTARDARVNRVERWGRRRLAYAINHKTEGYYLLLDVSAEPAAVDDLDRALRLTDEVVRHKIVRIPDHVAGRPRRSPSALPEPAETDADER
jgi:small subunit ribosomal protein S6